MEFSVSQNDWRFYVQNTENIPYFQFIKAVRSVGVMAISSLYVNNGKNQQFMFHRHYNAHTDRLCEVDCIECLQYIRAFDRQLGQPLNLNTIHHMPCLNDNRQPNMERYLVKHR